MFWRCAAAALILTCGLSGAALARQDGQLWTGANANLRLNDKWRLGEEVTFRFSDDRGGLYEIESATMLNHALTKKVTLAAGYIHNPRYVEGHATTTERRAREQITVDRLLTIGKGTVTGRLRAEQRWRDGNGATGWRLRPFVRYMLPLAGKTRLVLSNETFVNLNTTSFQRQPGFERMRQFAGINVPLSSKLALEAGYLNQYFFIRDGDDDVNHVASVSLTANF